MLAASEAVRSQVAVVHFAIVAYQFDGAVDKVVTQADLGAEFTFHTEQTPDDRIFTGEEIIHILGCNTQLFSLDHAVDYPMDHVCQSIIALRNCRSERLLRHDKI